MGTYEFKLPDIGEGVVEGEVVEWHVAKGDTVIEDQPLVDMMTDKATVMIPSSVNGTVVKLAGAPGDMIPVGSTLIILEIDGQSDAEEEILGEQNETENSGPTDSPKDETPTDTSPAPVTTSASRGVRASPAVRRRATQAGIDLTQVSGSGPAGRITQADLDTLGDGADLEEGGDDVDDIPETEDEQKTMMTGTTEIPVLGLRRKIAEQMKHSTSTIPHFSYFEEIDVTELETLRQNLNLTRTADQPKLTYLPFIMLALDKAFTDLPQCNAHHLQEEGKVVRYEAAHIGIATQTERGLYVPVVKDVGSRDIWGNMVEMRRVTDAARGNTATLDELTGSTFTITSLGKDGGLGATPIINAPEVGILGVHKANDRAVVREGQIVVRRIMNVSSSWDHSVVDGYDGAMLIQRLRSLLENPTTIFT